MKTVAIKMRNYVNNASNNISIVDNNDLPRRIFHFMVLALGILAFCYVLVLGNMVFNIVERKTLESQARALSNEVRDLELTYLSMSDKVDLAFSYSMGFKEAKAQFATRKSLKSLGSLAKAKNEI